ncbi:hypothetical protein MM326_03405 [Alkalihalobacillus sp. LMS6]|nr:hypothetical protein [Alkalihalobacillus sp. LMS6]UTR07093.1 hypothetical protein MM326_03405 [Alkalihalobacillus sp. LMS6]
MTIVYFVVAIVVFFLLLFIVVEKAVQRGIDASQLKEKVDKLVEKKEED